MKCLHDLMMLIMLIMLLSKPTGEKKNLNVCKKKLEIGMQGSVVKTAKRCVSTGRWECKGLFKQRNGD